MESHRMVFVHEGVRALNEVGLEVVLKRSRSRKKWVRRQKRGRLNWIVLLVFVSLLGLLLILTFGVDLPEFGGEERGSYWGWGIPRERGGGCEKKEYGEGCAKDGLGT